MSTPNAPDDRHHAPSPDPAALDELHQAFDDPADDQPSDDDRSADDRSEDARPDDAGESDDAGSEADEGDDGAPGSADDAGSDESTAAGRPPAKVIEITDDEIPDAVYVRGDLVSDPGSPSGNVVFIDDHGIDTVGLEESGGSRRTIEPRLRDRRIAVRRAEGRRRLRWFVIVGAVVAVLVGALALLGSPLFAIEADQVRVTGAVYTDPEQLQAVVDELVGTPTLVADTHAAERALEEIPWVESARVRTDFPRAASIEIRERKAMVTYQGPDGRFRVLDRDGRVLDVLDGQPIAYVLVVGTDPLDLAPGQFAQVGYAAAGELVQGLTSSIRGRVAWVEVAADGSSLRLHLDDGAEVRFGAATELLTKLVRLETALGQVGAATFSVIDVSTAEMTVQ